MIKAILVFEITSFITDCNNASYGKQGYIINYIHIICITLILPLIACTI